jgi:glucose/mannose-6-phosphate isomerase
MESTMTLEEVRRIDPSGMYDLLRKFPLQVEEAVSIGTQTPLKLRKTGITSILLCGMGGSAIGGEFLRTYLAGELSVPFLINRNYTLPAFVGPHTLVIISSYSGNTEETEAAHKEAKRKHARLLCISSNGLVEKAARRDKSPFIKIPGGLPPRAALGYSFFPLLLALQRAGFIRNQKRDIAETVSLLHTLADRYGNPEEETNQALRLARELQNRIGVVYSGTDRFDAVNVRWRGQIAENGKSLMWGHVVPEMNHNELVGWHVLRDQMKEMQVVLLRDIQDHKRVGVRLDLTKQILGGYTNRITEIRSEGRSPLARMFSLIVLGDWVSMYLAVLHGVDPTPVAVIDRLKHELANI